MVRFLILMSLLSYFSASGLRADEKQTLAELESVLTETIRLYEAKDYEKFIQVAVNPKVLGEVSKDELIKQIDQSREKILEQLKLALKIKPVIEKDGTVARYENLQTARHGIWVLVMEKQGDSWYIDGRKSRRIDPIPR